MNLKEKQIDGILVLTVAGRLAADCAEEFKRSILDTVGRSRRIVLDLTELEYIDSTGLGALVFMLQRVMDNGGKLRLAGLQVKPRIVFDLTKAQKIFDIYESVGEAMAADW